MKFKKINETVHVIGKRGVENENFKSLKGLDKFSNSKTLLNLLPWQKL